VIDPASGMDHVADVAFDGGKIAAIGKGLSRTGVGRVIEAQQKLVVPGLIDPHVHLREPGGEHKETLATGELTFVNNTVDTTTAMIQLKATFANENNVLWPGQFVDVAMVITSRTAIVVPSQAIQPGQQGPYVFVVKPDQTVESRLVTPGVRLGAETIVEKGLKPAERVVTDGQLRLVPGARIEARPPKAS